MYKRQDADTERQEYYTSLLAKIVPGGISYGYTISYELTLLLARVNHETRSRKYHTRGTYRGCLCVRSHTYIRDGSGGYFGMSILRTLFAAHKGLFVIGQS